MSSMANFRGDLLLRLRNFYDILVVAPFDGGEHFFLAHGIQCVNIALDRKGMNPGKDFALFFDLLKIYRRFMPDAIFHYTIKPCIWGSWAAGILHIHNISVITGLGYAFSKKGWLRRIVMRLYQFALRKNHCVCFLNEGDLNFFTSNSLIRHAQAFLLSGEGVDCNFFKSADFAIPPALGERYQKSTPRFLLIGRILYDKGIEVYAKAANIILKIMQEKGLSAESMPKFYVLGPNDLNNPSHILPDILKNWPIECLGETKDVRPYIQYSDCIVLPSFSEGLPRVLLEAMSMEKPIIASRLSGIERLIQEQENGFLCEPRDVNSLVHAMMQFLNLKEDMRLQMGRVNRQKVKVYFSNDVVYKEYLNILDFF